MKADTSGPRRLLYRYGVDALGLTHEESWERVELAMTEHAHLPLGDPDSADTFIAAMNRTGDAPVGEVIAGVYEYGLELLIDAVELTYEPGLAHPRHCRAVRGTEVVHTEHGTGVRAGRLPCDCWVGDKVMALREVLAEQLGMDSTSGLFEVICYLRRLQDTTRKEQQDG